MADYFCQTCGGEFYGDLPSGQALDTPFLLDKKSGAVFGDGNAVWFADWLANSYKNRTNESLSIETKIFSPVKDKVILLNCLDTLYGHSLLKLLNAQYYLEPKTRIQFNRHRAAVSRMVAARWFGGGLDC